MKEMNLPGNKPHIRTVVAEESKHLHVSFFGCDVKRCLKIRVEQVWLEPIEQGSNTFIFPILSRTVNWCVVIEILFEKARVQSEKRNYQAKSGLSFTLST